MRTLRATWLRPKRRISGADNNRRKPRKGTFMTVRTRTQVTIQTRQTVVVIPLRDSCNTWYERCRHAVVHLTPESSIKAFRISPYDLRQILEGGKWQLLENGAQSIWVCCNYISTNPIENEFLIEGERP